MHLFSFCKSYIVKKFDTHVNAYAEKNIKDECRVSLKGAIDYNILKSVIVYYQANQFHSIGNYMVLINFCIYAMNCNYPYSQNSFDHEFVVDFIWIETSNKKDTTKVFYSGLISTFVNTYNLIIHNDNRSLGISMSKAYYSSYYSYNQRLTDEELYRIFLTLPSKDDNFIVMFNVLLRTGIRVSEMLSIRKKDIYNENGLFFFKIKGKGLKYRMVAMPQNNFRPFYMSKIRSLNNDEYIFQTKKNTRITRQFVYRGIKKFFLQLGISKEQNGPHVLRHTFASKLYEKHQDIILVQECLGHTNIEITRKYIHLHISNLKKIADLYDDFCSDTLSVMFMFSITNVIRGIIFSIFI
ncbi:DNA breaking-rejoining enzyme [Sulfurospirillum multivorans DSM 12446]|uniref:DNA breaking-rejoining enzyme n=3 Tax=Sulfurospirillum multivorans TaxID=66821 RepID=A0AA86E2V7_SULMK|nr:DNA breaking-rejoining enzyme [Sulfurospirillum multivorans DSM 12446]QEH06640.1 DNA breaking-rejoining enzyme [Sulfurospirillum multivorans]